VLEQDAATLKADELPFCRHGQRSPEFCPRPMSVLITGATLVNNTLEVSAGARPARRPRHNCRPTVGMQPDAFLARGPMFWARKNQRARCVSRPLLGRGAGGVSLLWPLGAEGSYCAAAHRGRFQGRIEPDRTAL